MNILFGIIVLWTTIRLLANIVRIIEAEEIRQDQEDAQLSRMGNIIYFILVLIYVLGYP